MGLVNLERLAIASGGSVSSNQHIAFARVGRPGIYHSTFKWNNDSRANSQTTMTAVTPLIRNNIRIYSAPDLLEDSSQLRRDIQRAVFRENARENVTVTNLSYLHELYYFVPLQIALKLHQQREYVAALDWFRTIYDYSQSARSFRSRSPGETGVRKIYYGLEQEELLEKNYQRADNWLLDPLNPHQIASTRRNSYTRFTLLSLVRCFLDYADAEFTLDSAESIPRARTLYVTALELLGLPELNQRLGQCDDIIGELVIKVGDDDLQRNIWWPVWLDLLESLRGVSDYAYLKESVQNLKEALALDKPWRERIAKAQGIVSQALAAGLKHPNFKDIIAERGRVAADSHAALLTQASIVEATQNIGIAAGQDFLNGVSLISGLDKLELRQGAPDIPWLRKKEDQSALVETTDSQIVMPSVAAGSSPSGVAAPLNMMVHADSLAASEINTSRLLWLLEEKLTLAKYRYIPAPSYHFCIPPNPILRALHLHAELNLYNLRNCRNIAGMEREIESYAAPTDTASGLPTIGSSGQLALPGAITIRPTQYRYKTLIERAKQLVSLAQQIESTFLSALQSRDSEEYNLMKARQDVRLARAGIRLQDLRVREAEGSVDLAMLQKNRAQMQVDHFEDLINEGESILELSSLALLQLSAVSSASAALLHYAQSEAHSAYSATLFSSAAAGAVVLLHDATTQAFAALSSLAAAASSGASALSTQSAVLSTLASYERRKQEWHQQRSLGLQDVRIGARQVRLAQDHVRVVGQERQIAKMQNDHADEIVEFLNKKFTSAELFDWMSGVLENVYRFFLQQSMAMAKLAENQLTFERQESPPASIQGDYWEAPTYDNMASTSYDNSPNRRGLTGSARLLQDIYHLDQHAFQTDKRKLQLTKVISLARLAPLEFQLFRETGVMPFATPLNLFDRDFPGHYLRLITSVRTSVIALIPPIERIKATLATTTGISRVVIGGNLFQTIILQRGPQSVALTSPQNATGLFELQAEAQSEMLLPFEGLGVDTTWEFRLPKPANALDYHTIADVLITIKYTALDSPAYRQQVIQQLDTRISGERPFSFRHQFADAWYDLHHPELIQNSQQPMAVSFTTKREDFPPNVTGLAIEHITLYIARTPKITNEMNVSLKSSVGNSSAKTVDGVVSTRGGNAAGWTTAFNGKTPMDEWTLTLEDKPEIRKLFEDDLIEDILFVITFGGRTAEWPQ